MSSNPTRAGSPAKEGKWLEYKNSDERTYWAHSVTKQSVWEKPDELRTPFEKAMNQTPWKQYDSKGRVYYVNSQTKETKWDMPAELEELKIKVQEEEYAKERAEREAATPLAIEDRASGSDPSTSLVRTDASAFDTNSDFIALPTSPSVRSRSPSPEPEIIRIPPGGFRTFEAAEGAFISLLKRSKVDESWTWDVTMRKIIMDPLYKALNTLAEKKGAWAKYQANLLATRDARLKDRLDKSRPGIHKLLTAHPKIKSYTTFKTAEQVLAGEKHWVGLEKSEEREVLFEEWVKGLKVAEENARVALRARNLSLLRTLIKELPITVFTRYREAKELVLQSDLFRTDPSLKDIDEIDMVEIFADYSAGLLREHDEQFRKTSVVRQRKGRKARDAYRALLHSMEVSGQITSLSKWKETRVLVENTPEYEALLGLPGSNPLELWQDLVDDLQEAVEAGVDKVERALKSKGEEGRMTLGLPYEEFQEILKQTHLAAQIDDKLHKQVYESIQHELQKIADDQKRRAERKRRHAIEDLRYALKKVEPPIDLDGTYEDALPAMEKIKEFQDINDEQDRREAFGKFVKRQKEKAESRDEKNKRRAEAADFDMDAAPIDRDGPREPRPHRSEHRKDRQRSASPGESEGGRGDRHRDRERRSDRDRESSRRDYGDRYDDERNDRDRYQDRDRDARKRKDKERDGRHAGPEDGHDEPAAKRSKLSSPGILPSKAVEGEAKAEIEDGEGRV